MKILVMGAGKMGSFFIDLLSFDHEVAVFERDPKRMRFTYNCQRFTSYDEIREFKPELLINAVTLKYTIPVFKEVIPYLPKECIISDIASVKTDLKDFYESTGMRYVSTHPMFGPTFANLQQLSEENAIIISEGDYMGRIFFKDLYQKLGLNIYEYTFEEHDKTVAYSLSIPFVSTFVFAAVMKHQDAPGTTFKRHMRIAKGVLNEDDYLLQEILFNPYTHDQVSQIRTELKELLEIIDQKDADGMKGYLTFAYMNAKRILKYLRQIAAHNNRAWYLEHKAEYDAIRADFEQGIAQALERIITFDPEVAHLQVKDCTYRFNRDTRFSPDKSPYKNHLGAYICAKGKKALRGGYYLHLEPGHCLLAVGNYWLPTNILTSCRNEMMGNTDAWLQCVENQEFLKYFEDTGSLSMNESWDRPQGFGLEKLKTCPSGFPRDWPYVRYLRLKDYCAWHAVPDSFFEGDGWLDEMERIFLAAKPMMDFMNAVIDDYE